MARKIEVQLLGDSRSLERAFLRSGKSGRTWARSMGIVRSGALAAGAAFAAVGIGAFKGIKAASNLAEQVNKSNVVFGKSAGVVEDWSKRTADAIGLSRRAALQAAGAYGQMLQTAGLNERASAKMSTELVNLAGDLASFNDIDPTLALDKLRSGLSGEAEPLRALGVFLSEARVKAEAYRSGIAKLGAELTEGQKVQARYNLILQDTSKAQGDFARTSDSLANSSRRVKAQLENAAAGLASRVLPTVANAVDAFAGFLDDFQQAQGAEAKLDVVFSGLENVGRDLYERVRDQIDDIDWSAAFDRAKQFIVEQARRAVEALDNVDYGDLARRLGERVTSGIDAVRDALGEVDWQQTARIVIRKLVAAIKDVVRDVDWIAIAKAIVKFLDAAIQAVIQTAIGLGKELGVSIIRGIDEAIENGKQFILRKLLEFVNKVLGITGFLGRFDPFAGVREKVQKQLDGMASDAKETAKSVNRSLASVKDRTVTLTVTTRILGGEGPGSGERVTSESEQAVPAEVQRGFDAAAQRAEAMGKAYTAAADAAQRASERAAAAARKAAARVAAARKKAAAQAEKLREQAEEAARKQRESFDNLLDALEFSATVEADRAGTKGDLKVNTQIQKAIQAQIRVEGKTTDLASKLYQARQDRKAILDQIAEQARTELQQRQNRALGFDAEGNKPPPTIKNLQKQLASLTTNIKGTSADTSANRAMLDRIRKVLLDPLEKATPETRERVKDIFDGIRDEFKRGTDSTRTQLTSGRKLDIHGMIGDLGLNASTSKELASRLSRIQSDGTVSVRARTAFGQPLTSTAGGPIIVHSHLHVDGKEMASNTTKHQQRTKQRAATQTRGPFGGV